VGWLWVLLMSVGVKTAMSSDTVGGSDESPGFDLRHMFIAMLFAIVIGDVFSKSYTFLMGDELWGFGFLRAFFHISLMLILIISSWIKWSETFSGRVESKNKYKDYKLLVIDVFILFSYYVLIRLLDKDINYTLAANLIVFLLYFLWDHIEYDSNDEECRVSLYFSASSVCLYIAICFSDIFPVWLYQVFLILNVVLYRYLKIGGKSDLKRVG